MVGNWNRGAILYFVVAFTLGLMTLRNGHGWMFFFGIFFPFLWIFGAFMRPPERTAPAWEPGRVGAAPGRARRLCGSRRTEYAGNSSP